MAIKAGDFVEVVDEIEYDDECNMYYPKAKGFVIEVRNNVAVVKFFDGLYIKTEYSTWYAPLKELRKIKKITKVKNPEYLEFMRIYKENENE